MSDKNLPSIIENLISPAIREMKAYHVADASGMVKLDAMESPYAWSDTWSDALKQQWLEKMNAAQINRYPDPQGQGIKKRLREKYALNNELDIILGNGSDEIIQIMIMAVAASGQAIMAPAPSFVMYKVIADYVGLPFVRVPLNADFSLNTEAFLKAIEGHQPSIIFLATPNNPTGNVFADDDLEKIIQAAPGLVVLDEAYTAFTDSDQLHWLSRYDHVVVMRTFSKVGLAGLRLGFAIGQQTLLEEFDKLRLPYNINVLTQQSVEFALDNFALLEEHSQNLCAQRAELIDELHALNVFTCVPSEANFVTVRCLEHNAKDLFEALKAQNVLIKCLHGSHPSLEQCLRITVSTQQENATLLSAVKQAIK